MLLPVTGGPSPTMTWVMNHVHTQGGVSGRGSGGPQRSTRCRGAKGTALIEFAIIMPVLFLILFGIIEFGSAYFQNLDVRHGAREGVRLLAVNASPSNSESTQAEKIAREACNRMDVDPGSAVTITIDVNGSLVPDPTGDATINDIGDEVTITVSKPLDQLTGFLDIFLRNIVLSSTVKTRLEQPASYGDLASFSC